MKRTVLSCLAAVALSGAATVAMYTVASAEDCYGLNSARVCVTPEPSNYPSVNPTASYVNECVHVGSTCEPVSAPVPGVSRGAGPVADIECYTPANTCTQLLMTLLPPPE